MREKLAIIIPIYEDLIMGSDAYNSVCNTIEKCSERPIFFLLPCNRYVGFKVVESLKCKFDIRTIFLDDVHFASIQSYNKLLLSPDFYLEFNCFEFIAIVQTDVWIFKDGFNEYTDLGFTYIGGITFKRWYKKSYWRIDNILAPINGGMSIRKVDDFLEILLSNKSLGLSFFLRRLYFHWKRGGLSFRKVNEIIRSQSIKTYCKSPEYNEDIVLYLISQVDQRFRIPHWTQSKLFCWDSAPWLLFENFKELPMAAHAYCRDDFPYEGNRTFWSKYCR